MPSNYRPHAVFLVAASAGVLLLLAAVLQVAAWDLPSYYRSKGLDLIPASTFFDMFGHRPDAYLVAVVFWLWWPMVAVLAYCYHRHREPSAFSVAFLYGFACCWLLAAFVLAFMAFLCVSPGLTILLADLAASPDYMWVVSTVSWGLPVATLAFVIACWVRLRSRSGENHPTAAAESRGEQNDLPG